MQLCMLLILIKVNHTQKKKKMTVKSTVKPVWKNLLYGRTSCETTSLRPHFLAFIDGPTCVEMDDFDHATFTQNPI